QQRHAVAVRPLDWLQGSARFAPAIGASQRRWHTFSQSGTGARAIGIFHPDRRRYRVDAAPASGRVRRRTLQGGRR
nr:hypothetical protein [Tanacetum cinerariifolium]